LPVLTLAAVCVVRVLLEFPTVTVLPFETVVLATVVLPVNVLLPAID
jgi:hypothetical protein